MILQPSDARGNVKDGTEPVTGSAVVTTGAEFEAYEAKVKAKYGMMFRTMKMVGRFMKLIGRGSGTDTAVVITLD